MTAKQLLPNQCDLLHLVYGQCDCCLCEATRKIDELREVVSELKVKIAKVAKLAKK